MYDYGVVDYFEFILMECHGGMGNLQGDVDLEKQNQSNTGFLILNRPYPFLIVFLRVSVLFLHLLFIYILMKRSCNCGTIVLNCNILGDDFNHADPAKSLVHSGYFSCIQILV